MNPKRIISFIEGYDESIHKLLATTLKVDYCIYFMEKDNFQKSFVETNIQYFGLGRYPNMSLLSEECFDFELINYFRRFEHEIYMLIERFYFIYKTRSNFKKIRIVYLKLLNYGYSLITENKIDYMVFLDTAHQPLEFIIFNLARKIGIPILSQRELPNLYSFKQNLKYTTLNYPLLDYRFDEGLKTKVSSNELVLKLSPEMKNLYDEFLNFDLKVSKLVPTETHLGAKVSLKSYIRYFNLRKKNIPQLKSLLSKSISFLFYRIFLNNIMQFILTKHYDRLSISPDLGKEFFYFPLHFQPEATTNPLGSIFQNQFIAIKSIQQSLPDNILLYVKEHPAYWKSNLIEGMHTVRSKKFYNEIYNLKNVRIIKANSNPYELIIKSLGVVTITGTVAFEAFGFNKPAIVFGNYFYSQFANAIQPSNLHDLTCELKKLITTPKNYRDDFIKTLYSLDQISYILKGDNHNSDKIYSTLFLANTIKTIK